MTGSPHKAERNAKIAAWAKDNPCSPLQEIGDHYGITRERVRQILKNEGVHKIAAQTAKAPGPLYCTSCGKEANPTSRAVRKWQGVTSPYICRPCRRVDVACTLCGQLVSIHRSLLLAKVNCERRYARGEVWCSECEHVRREITGRVLGRLPRNPETGRRDGSQFAKLFEEEFEREVSHMHSVAAER